MKICIVHKKSIPETKTSTHPTGYVVYALVLLRQLPSSTFSTNDLRPISSVHDTRPLWPQSKPIPSPRIRFRFDKTRVVQSRGISRSLAYVLVCNCVHIFTHSQDNHHQNSTSVIGRFRP